MSVTSVGNVIRLYGGNPSGDFEVQTGMFNPSNQEVTELLVVGTYTRLIKLPLKSHILSWMVCVDVAGGAGSVGALFYSDLPNPNPATPGDWVADPTNNAIALTATGNTMIQVANQVYEYAMFKATVAVSSLSFRVFARPYGSGI